MDDPAGITLGLGTAIGGGGIGSAYIMKLLYDFVLTKKKSEKTQEEGVNTVAFEKEFIEHKTMVNMKLDQYDELLHEINDSVRSIHKKINTVDKNVAVLSERQNKG